MSRLLTRVSSLSLRKAAPFAGAAIVLGIVVVVVIRAAGPLAAFEAESGTIAGAACSTNQSGASGGKTVQFGGCPTGDGVINTDGTVNATGYRAMAAKLATDEGISYRFGKSAAQYGAPANTATAYEPPTKQLPASYNSYGNQRSSYQLGTPNASKDDFSSNQGQVGYVPGSGSPALGVDSVVTLEVDVGTVTHKPALSWTNYGQGHPEYDLSNDINSNEPHTVLDCVQKKGLSLGHFVAQARAYAHSEARVNALLAFDNGVIAAGGINTSRGTAEGCVALPAGLVPTAISLTNGNEYALVTVWNTAQLKGQLAVIALGGKKDPDYPFCFDWPELYPGFRNFGNPSFLKYLGTVDLPGMAAPTGLSAVSDYSFGDGGDEDGDNNDDVGHGGTICQSALSNEEYRQQFVGDSYYYSKKKSRAGYAVVTSRSEKKAVFVDLQPLFDKLSGQLFGTRAQFNAAVGNIGQGDSQFPQRFSNLPAAQPVVVKTLQYANPVTAAAAMLSGSVNPRAYVATEDGTLHTVNVGGLANTTAASTAAVAETGTVAVGRNVTNITYPKDISFNTAGLNESLDNTLVLTSRGDRKIQWVTLAGEGGSVKRTLADSRMVDPIASEINDNHGTESYYVSIADYGASRLFNFRYGPVIMHTMGGDTFGMGADGRASFEYGGDYSPGGKPFSITLVNVT